MRNRAFVKYWQPADHDLGDLPLGRNVHHDIRSVAYAYPTEGLTLTSAAHPRHVPILDQGNLGSCTGNAAAGALGSEACSNGLAPTQIAGINEKFAVNLYAAATKIDPFPGVYPPTDTGSDGLSAAKVMQINHWISGYLHTFSLNDALLALGQTSIMVGIDWYEGFDNPDPRTGLVSISGSVRGGHELAVREINVPDQLVWLDNSWGTSWGLAGRCCMSFDTLGTLLAKDGDVTIPQPLVTNPPAPPTPVLDKPTAADLQLQVAIKAWQASKDW